jgi:hypothetical protein
LVERVTFHNAENGFCVLRVKARGQRDLITVVGHAATITAGEFVELNGNWGKDRTHQSQFGARMGFCNGRVRPSPLSVESNHRSDYRGNQLVCQRRSAPAGSRDIGDRFTDCLSDRLSREFASTAETGFRYIVVLEEIDLGDRQRCAAEELKQPSNLAG